MSDLHLSTTATTTRLVMSFPQGRITHRRVKEFSVGPTFPDESHPDQQHIWREMLHYGQRGTGFVECVCGAMGIPYGRSRR